MIQSEHPAETIKREREADMRLALQGIVRLADAHFDRPEKKLEALATHADRIRDLLQVTA